MEKNKKYYEDYARYLESISFKAKIYRKFFYFPKLYKFLKGAKLEIGCGTGAFLAKYNDVLGIDINPELINICKSKNLNANLMHLDKIPYEDNSFDSILIDNVLEHIKDPKPLMQEVRRVTRDHGIVVISVPGAKGFQWDKDHKIFYDEDNISKLFCEFGFVTDRIFYSPIKNSILNSYMRQYCMHAIFSKRVV